MKKIAIGCDEAAFDLKQIIIEFLGSSGYETEDYGVYNKDASLYPDTAIKVAVAVSEGNHDRGILLCGTGIGMAISANKVPGIRAAVCHDCYSAERARKSNNAQIMTMGSRVIGTELAKQLVEIWMKSEFQGGGSASKVDRIMEYERGFIAGGTCKCKE
ncbi:MAG TPA: ribose 5-phosphate isomerase B [Anaerovoracaceae bacterium]|nr:ribose 5-phosphate isomerase B [Anaerovoracaceae bacterium]